MKNVQRILTTIGVGLVLVFGFYFITDAITKYTGFSVSPVVDNDFETCLKGQDIVLYINSAESSETLRNIELVDYLENFEIVNCFNNNQGCLDNDVNSFPTWIVNKNKILGDITLIELKELSGCKLN